MEACRKTIISAKEEYTGHNDYDVFFFTISFSFSCIDAVVLGPGLQQVLEARMEPC